MSIWKRAAALLAVTVMAAVLLLPMPAAAAQDMASLTVRLHCGNVALQNVPGTLYRVASLNGTNFELEGDFAGSAIRLNGLTTEEWKNAAESLALYAQANSASVTATASSDGEGAANFGSLSVGLYLFVCAETVQGSCRYTVAPALFSLPDWSTGTPVFDVTASPKCEEYEVPGPTPTPSPETPPQPTPPPENPPENPPQPTPSPKTPDTTSIRVIKIWNDAGYQSKRPGYITVTLFCDGRAYATADLSAANNWRCTFTGLTGGHRWNVLENRVPGKYTVGYSRTGTTFYVSNYYGTMIADDSVPLGLWLPQTGQLWWPVPLLAAAGMVLFGFGWKRRMDDENKKN